MCLLEPMPKPILLLQLTFLIIIKAGNNIDNLKDVPPPDNPMQIKEEDIDYNNITSIKRDTN